MLGPVQTSCFCCAELNSGIKFDKSMPTEASQRFKRRASVVPSKINKLIMLIIFWRDCVPTGSQEENYYEVSVNPEFNFVRLRHN